MAVRERMAAAAQSAGRAVEQVRLVAASKTVTPSVMAELATLGVTCFGENRVEEAEAKLPAIRALLGAEAFSATRWCLVGHLQSRKAARAVQLFEEIHSVDSLKLALRLARLLTDKFHFVRRTTNDPGLVVYETVDSLGRQTGLARFRTADVVKADQSRARYEVELVIDRPS